MLSWHPNRCIIKIKWSNWHSLQHQYKYWSVQPSATRHYDWTLSITFRTFVISAQLFHNPELDSAFIQCTGGFGSTLGDGGSLNFAPAYAGDDFWTGDLLGDLRPIRPRPLWGSDFKYCSAVFGLLAVVCRITTCGLTLLFSMLKCSAVHTSYVTPFVRVFFGWWVGLLPVTQQLLFWASKLSVHLGLFTIDWTSNCACTREFCALSPSLAKLALTPERRGFAIAANSCLAPCWLEFCIDLPNFGVVSIGCLHIDAFCTRASDVSRRWPINVAIVQMPKSDLTSNQFNYLYILIHKRQTVLWNTITTDRWFTQSRRRPYGGHQVAFVYCSIP